MATTGTAPAKKAPPSAFEMLNRHKKASKIALYMVMKRPEMIADGDLPGNPSIRNAATTLGIREPSDTTCGVVREILLEAMEW